MNNALQIYDAVVIGGGPAGLAAAIALAATGARCALLARRVPYADNRTTALLGASTDLLERLDVWPRCRDKAAALQVMRLVDDTGRLIRAPEPARIKVESESSQWRGRYAAQFSSSVRFARFHELSGQYAADPVVKASPNVNSPLLANYRPPLHRI